MTVFNLLSGCLAAIFVFSGELQLASWMVALAAVFDFLDGFLARLLKASSEIGKMLDSLADMVSFGLAPGLIMFRLMEASGELPYLLAYLALLIPAFSAIRLARFSVDDRQSERFIGMPTPMNALLIASFPLILIQYHESEVMVRIFTDPWFLVAVTVCTSLMLVAPLGIIAMKFKSFAWKGNQLRYLLIISAVILGLTAGYLALPVFYLFYISLSVLENSFDLRAG